MNRSEPVKPRSLFELTGLELSDQVAYLGSVALVHTFVVTASLPTYSCLQRWDSLGQDLILPSCHCVCK